MMWDKVHFLNSQTIPLPIRDVAWHLRKYAQGFDYITRAHAVRVSLYGTLIYQYLVEFKIPLGRIEITVDGEHLGPLTKVVVTCFSLEGNPEKATNMFLNFITDWHEKIMRDRESALLKLLESDYEVSGSLIGVPNDWPLVPLEDVPMDWLLSLPTPLLEQFTADNPSLDVISMNKLNEQLESSESIMVVDELFFEMSKSHGTKEYCPSAADSMSDNTSMNEGMLDTLNDSMQEQADHEPQGTEGDIEFTPWKNNTYEMLKWPELETGEFWDKMHDSGKVVTFSGWHSINSPVTLFGFSEEDISNAYRSKLTVRDLLVAIEEVYTGHELPYEHEKGETFHKYWLLDENKQRTVGVSIAARDGRDSPKLLRDYRYGGGLSQMLINCGDEKKISAWVSVLKVFQTEIDHKLIFRAANIVEEEQWAAENMPIEIGAPMVENSLSLPAIEPDNGRRHYQPIVINWNRGELFDWLTWRYTTTYAIEPWRSMTSQGEEFIYGLCPYSPCVMNVYLKVEALSPNQTRITPKITTRRESDFPIADAEIDNLRRQLETAGGMMPQKSKRGPRPKTIQEKIDALKAWDNLDRDRFAINLDDWLDERFGNTGGKLNVPPSTFHGWRRYLKNS